MEMNSCKSQAVDEQTSNDDNTSPGREAYEKPVLGRIDLTVQEILGCGKSDTSCGTVISTS